MLQTFSLACFAACISALTLEGQVTADAQIESQAMVEATTSQGIFVSTLRVAAYGLEAGAPSFLSVGTDCNNKDDIHLSFGDDSSGRMTWWFFPDGEYYRIRNQFLADNGCEHNAWLRSNQSCGDNNAIRDIYYAQSLWKVEPTEDGFYNLISEEKERFCQHQNLSTRPNGQDVFWHFDDRSGRQAWALQVPVKSLAKEIKSITGHWQLFASGSGQLESELTRSVESETGNTVTNQTTKKQWVSGTVEVGVEVAPKSVKVSLTAGGEWAQTEATETSTQLTTSSESVCSAKCFEVEGKRAYLYQWVKMARSASSSLTLNTCHYTCTYENFIYPKCPPRDCLNQECTICDQCKACEGL